MSDDRMKWNLNTIILGISLVGIVGGWGWAWGDVQSTLVSNRNFANAIDKRVASLETSIRQIDNHELRIANLEKQSSDTASSLKSMANTMSELSTDMKVTREILQRLERDRLGSVTRQ